jgi:hypothetical protein
MTSRRLLGNGHGIFKVKDHGIRGKGERFFGTTGVVPGREQE